MDTCHTRVGYAGTLSSCVASGDAMMPWPPMATPAGPLARVSPHFLSLPPSAPSHHVCHYLASLRKRRAWVCPRVIRCRICYLHGQSLDSVTEVVATAASATFANVVGMIGTEAGLSVQSVAMKVQLVRPTSVSSSEPSSPILSHGINQLDPLTLPKSEPACVGLEIVRAMLNSGCHALLTALSFLLTTNLSDPPIWRCPRHTVGARPRNGVPFPAHTARRVPHRDRKSRALTTCHRCARTTTTRAVGAALPRLTGGAHARRRRPRWGQRKHKAPD